MNPNERRHFSQMMMVMAELHAKPFSEALTDIYWESLKDFELDVIRGALIRHVRDTEAGRFFPKPADIVRLIEGSSENCALQAWSKVERAFSQVGRYQSLAFDDGLIHAVIQDMGGWIKLCAIHSKELPFCAQEFQKRYQGYVNRAPLQIPPYLSGMAERDNAKDGYPIAAPVFVGDPQKNPALVAPKPSQALAVDEPVASMRHLIKAVFKAQQQPEDSHEKN